jgi:hypothetical protein
MQSAADVLIFLCLQAGAGSLISARLHQRLGEVLQHPTDEADKAKEPSLIASLVQVSART